MARATGGIVAEGAQVRERRYVYGGSTPTEWSPTALRPNRPGVRRRVSTFNVMLLLFATGGAIVFYISNILSINRLAAEVGQLEAEYQKIEGINQSLRAEVSRKAALEEIAPFARDQLGLRTSPAQQIWFTIDREKLTELEAARGTSR